MPTITLNKTVFEELVGKKLELEELKNRISMLGTDLESIEGDEIHVEIFPNRPDLLSEQGFARAFASFIGVKPGLKIFNVEKPEKDFKVIIDESVKEIRPYTACAIVKNLKFDDEKIREVIQIQEKLHVTFCRNRKKAAIGIYPLEAIKLPITYKAMKPKDIKFQPLEWKTELDGEEILEVHPAGKEYGYLLEGKPRYPVFVDADDEILSLPPIINSHKTGRISEDTTEVFVECSGFDFHVLGKCLNMIVAALNEMGGELYSMDLEYPDWNSRTPNLEPEKKSIDLKYINKVLGLGLKEEELKKYLEMMGYGYESNKVLVPAYRSDVLHQVDFAEDIAIAYGYENFEEVIPNVATIGQESPFEAYKNKIANALTGLGLVETSSYNLIDKETQTTMMLSEMKPLNILDPVSLEYNTLRMWMIPSMLDILKNNKSHEYPQNIFEIGRIFKPNEKTETKTVEAERLCVAIAQQDADFTKIKQVFDYLIRALNLKYESIEVESTTFIDGRVARIIINGEKVAYIGEVNPQVLANFELEVPVAVFELNLTDLFNVTRTD